MLSSSDIFQAGILIVDDQASNLSLLQQMLHHAGYTNVTAAQDPRTVCDLHRRHRYDLILLDLQMPDLDGFEVMAGLKEIEPKGVLPVLVITAQPAHKLRALAAGARDFVTKPFDLAEVLMRVHNLLELRLLHHRETARAEVRVATAQHVAGFGDWDYDFATDRLNWSEEVYRILGIARKDFPPDSATFYRQVHPDDLAMVHREKEAAASGSRRVNFEHRIIRPGGEVRYIHQCTEMVLDAHGRPAHESGTLHDITARKLADGELRRSEERYRRLLMLSPDANFVYTGGLVTLVNHAFCQLMGATAPEQLLGRVALDIVHPGDRACVRARIAQLHAGKPLPAFELRFLRLDGSTVEVEATSVAFAIGGPMEVHVIARDITIRRQAEQAAQRQQTELRVLFDLMPAMLWFKDTENRILRVNRHAAKNTGKTIAEIEGKSAVEIYPRQAARFFADDLMVIRAGTPKLGIIELLRDEENHELWVQTDKVPVHDKDGKVVGIVVMAQDITARRLAESALRESEERFKFVARAVSDAVWDWNIATGTFWRNDGFLATFGFAAGEIEPGVKSWPNRIHPDERARVVTSIHQAINGNADSWTAEYRFECKDGHYAPVQDRGYILRDTSGRGIRMVGGMRDLTEQKKMEAQYLRAQRMEGIGTLAGGIAHDLNNVFAPIMMSIELLKYDSANDPRRRKILDIIHVSSQRGADLVRQVLGFARGQDGQQVAVQLRSLIVDLESIISETFPRDIHIVANAPNNLWPVMGDPTQLSQVLLNLAVNARDAMPAGGRLTVDAANVTLDAQYAGMHPEAKAGPYVSLEVTDTGTGIPPEIRARIFEPFFTTKDIGKGTGIGLATVHTVVKSHGGFMQLDSAMGRGTTFRVFLPSDPALRGPPTADPFPIAIPQGQDELILVIDDEYSIRDITRQTLQAFGYRVLTARDGAEAIALYAPQSRDIALVLTDMMMPILDGAATIQVLRRINPDIRIIASSGVDSADHEARSTSSGTGDFLLKPYTAQTLLTRIREVLDRPPASIR